jgi:hypothetical protein
MEPFATLDDLQQRFRTLSIDEQTRASALLEDASNIIRQEFDICGREIDLANSVLKGNITYVCCAMVKRVIANGVAGDYTQYSQTVGSFNEQYTFANPQGDMYLTAAERRLLGIPKHRSKIMFIMPELGGTK